MTQRAPLFALLSPLLLAGCAEGASARATQVELPPQPALAVRTTRTMGSGTQAEGASAPWPGHVVVRQDNELQRALRLERVAYAIDGKQVLARADAGLARLGSPLEVFDGTLAPGSHEIAVRADLAPYDPAVLGYDEPVQLTARLRFEVDDASATSLLHVRIVERELYPAPLAQRFALAFGYTSRRAAP